MGKLTYKDMKELHTEFVDKREASIKQAWNAYKEQCGVVSPSFLEAIPLKVGDVIIIKGYSHTNKKAIIDEIGIVQNNIFRGKASCGLGALCTVLKADGSLSKYNNVFSSIKHLFPEELQDGK